MLLITVKALPHHSIKEPDKQANELALISQAMLYLNADFTDKDRQVLQRVAEGKSVSKAVLSKAKKLLDSKVLLTLNVANRNLIDVSLGSAKAQLIQGGWSTFLVKIINRSQISAPLDVISPNALPVLHKSKGNQEPLPEHRIPNKELRQRFLETRFYTAKPLRQTLSGAPEEYAVLQIYTRSTGRKQALLGFKLAGDIDSDTALIPVVFEIQPATKVVFRVKDYDGSPAMASFTIYDGINRLVDDELQPLPDDYRHRFSLRRLWERVWRGETYKTEILPGERLVGIYPLPARRVAAIDDFPDFYFQSQIYRADGEYIFLPPGEYRVTYTRGPEYLKQTRKLIVKAGVKQQLETFQLRRWVNMARQNWFSSDLHTHATGCKHYESPQQGVLPEHMWRQARGEDLNVMAVLNWGPGWYLHKGYFDQQKENPASDMPNSLLRYDVEVSHFPSSHLGHLGLYNLKEDDYPGAEKIEDWPSWTWPILVWAKSQDAVTGYLHSGWGMQPEETTTELPNYLMPKMDGIGANEYLVSVAQEERYVDLLGVGDTSPIQELNLWYHALNSGFQTRIIGESDFPCIVHDRVGVARGYAKMKGPLTFEKYIKQMQQGNSYVSDGKVHIIDFSVDDLALGDKISELLVKSPKAIRVQARVNGLLAKQASALEKLIASSSDQRQPTWAIEKARLGDTQNILVELVVNGIPVDSREVIANGEWWDIDFTYQIQDSSWLALRVFPAAHTNPIFVNVDGRPIRASRQSAEWMRDAIDRLWQKKSLGIQAHEKAEAKKRYERAKQRYNNIILESIDK